jgi:hypothetical protein
MQELFGKNSYVESGHVSTQSPVCVSNKSSGQPSKQFPLDNLKYITLLYIGLIIFVLHDKHNIFLEFPLYWQVAQFS